MAIEIDAEGLVAALSPLNEEIKHKQEQRAQNLAWRTERETEANAITESRRPLGWIVFHRAWEWTAMHFGW